MVRGSNPTGVEIFPTCPDQPWGPLSLLYCGYQVTFPRGKAAGVWRWPSITTSAEVKERVELYLCSHSGHSWPVPGWTPQKESSLIIGCKQKNSGPGSSVSIVTDYGLDGLGIESRWGENFPPVQTCPGAHLASCKMGTGSFPGVKVRPGRAADHSPLSSAVVMEE